MTVTVNIKWTSQGQACKLKDGLKFLHCDLVSE